MKVPENSFKQRLLAGDTQYGLWLGLAHMISAEICASAGFDWLLIDGEHGPNDLNTILEQLLVIEGYPSQPVVRPPDDDPVFIKQLLETGAQTLMIPMVESAEQAERAVRAMRYPPEGFRGVGSALARSANWGRIGDYVHTANEQMCLLAQVESVQGLENLDEIRAVEGVDGVFFGAVDLAASMGYLGRSNHPEVVRVIEDGLRRVSEAGTWGGVLCADKPHIERYQAAGARFLAVGVDTMLLSGATSALRAEFVPDEDGGVVPRSY
ncbi:MAG: aldolase/citrate lyase family protein [Gammaproteobacteria bacterium]